MLRKFMGDGPYGGLREDSRSPSPSTVLRFKDARASRAAMNELAAEQEREFKALCKKEERQRRKHEWQSKMLEEEAKEWLEQDAL